VTAAPGAANLPVRGPLPVLSDYVNTIKARGQRLDDQGVLIESLETGQLFAQHNADVTFNPASVMKLATSLVALAAHGPDYRYRTNILADGPIDPATRALEGDLVIEGGSDPMFSLADAQEVAIELSRLGVSRVRGALRVAGPFYYFANGYRSNLSLETSANKLRAAFQRAGIRIEGETISGEKSGTLLLSHYSEPLVSLLLYQNAHSSNAVAEVVGASLGGPQGIHDYLVKELGLSESEIFVGRASGLDFNRITPRATVKVLRALLKILAEHALKPEDVMPVAGVDSGTLRGRLDREDVRGAVIAKTGTLVTIDNGVSTLVGIAYTRAHGPLLFAVFNSGGNVYAYRRLQDQFIEQLIADEGGALSGRRSEDALAGDTRNTILQVFAGAEKPSAEVTAE
jgi:D-alanyl-D-alanine carboxypeptidase/D-alanyl-D-alanine-endopeptidase (penicillin-binding protein 4)